jgi:hypothetical protein
MSSKIFEFMSEHPIATVFITWAICDVPIKLARIIFLKNNLDYMGDIMSIHENIKELNRKVKILECIIERKFNL